MTRTGRVVLLICLAIAVWFAWDMLSLTSQQQLWGWRPLGLLAASWTAILMVLGRSGRGGRNQRWLGLSSLSGLCLALGFPPSPVIPFVFIGFIPLLLVEHEVEGSDVKRKGLKVLGFAFNAFLIWNICTTWWVLNTSFMPGIVANVLNAFFMSLVFLIYHHVKRYLGHRLHWLILSAIWISWEWGHMQWELSWPWLTLGNSFAQYPAWAQWYEYTGVFGGTLWILAVNGLLFQFLLKRLAGNEISRREQFGILALLVLPIIAGVVRYYTYDTPEGNTEIAVLQPNYEPHYSKFVTSQRDQLNRFVELSDSILTDETAYLVFPETSFGYIELTRLENDYRIRRLRDLFKNHPQVKLVTGLATRRRLESDPGLPSIRTQLDRNGDTIYWDIQNSAVQLERDERAQVYFKSKLVPGAEIFPFREVLPFIEPLVQMLDGTTAGHTIQEKRAVFKSNSGVVAPVICYESVYGDYVGDYVRLGAGILFIVTNDGWWDNTPGHIQHLKLGALRAIEHRRPIARSANTGISCFISERGEVLQPTRYGETTAIRGNLNASPTKYTFYTLWGDVIARIALFLFGLFVVLAISRKYAPPK